MLWRVFRGRKRTWRLPVQVYVTSRLTTLRFDNLGAGATLPSVASGASRFAFNSYFGRLNYTLKDKYLLTFTGRGDGSSKFGENHKFAFFPSAALAWKVSDEEFLKSQSLISNLKVRTSYGLTGNSEIPPYSSLGC
jgi:hypothetical protein